MEIRFGNDPYRQNKEAIEGPTRKQALKMAEYRKQLLATSTELVKAGRDETAFECDSEAWDVEAALIEYGFDPETGKPRKG